MALEKWTILGTDPAFGFEYVMLKSKPLVGPVMGGVPCIETSEWTTPGPSMPATQAVPPLLTQWISSFGEALKLAARRLPVMLKSGGLILVCVGSGFIAMSQTLNGSRFATFTR